LLPTFDDISQPVPQYQPGFVYSRRQPSASQILPDTDPVAALVALRRSSCICCPPGRYSFSAILNDTTVPTSYSQATKHACWKNAMQEEL
jgi:hypothetical protein